MTEPVNLFDMENCFHAMGSEAVRKVFFNHLEEIRTGYVETLINKESPEARYKIQMIDEVFSFEEELMSRIKDRKNSGES